MWLVMDTLSREFYVQLDNRVAPLKFYSSIYRDSTLVY